MSIAIVTNSVLSSTPPHACGVLHVVARGGAALVASSYLTDTTLLHQRGGGTKRKDVKLKVQSKSDSLLGISTTPEGKSVILMAIAMSLHYFGYSLARPTTVSLFTSATTGYKGSAAAFAFAMAFVSPVSLIMLLGYTRVLEQTKPKGALIASTLFCSAVIIFGALAITFSERTNLLIAGIPAAKFVSGPMFIFRESYVQFLTSQYWAFMASVLTPNQSARWFGPIAGLTSITSAIAGFTVSPLVQLVGQTGILVGTGIMLLASTFFASASYQVAKDNGFEPQEITSKHNHLAKKGSNPNSNSPKENMFVKATNLFKRVPVLWALFMEIMASQGLATVLNICFVSRLGTAITNDSDRAGWVGKYFSIINIITMTLQIGILPRLMTFLEPKDLWRVLPILSLPFTFFQALQKDPTLYLVASSLLVIKVSEYSIRRLLDEMIFVPLDFESRFLGKEVLAIFGYRFGKSLMSLALSALAVFDSNFGLQKQSVVSNVVGLAWLGTAWKLSNMVPTRAEAEEAHQKNLKLAKR
jgi:ATP/ADP translocase